jgi:ATP-dependent DNA helicase RecG
MQVTTFNEDELMRMVAGGETETVEFKIKPPRLGELAERICGMANTRTGGTILFGVEDRTGKLVGIRQLGDSIDQVLRAVRFVKPVVPLPPPGPTACDVNGVQVVAMQVPPNNGTLYQASGVFWKRQGSHTVPMSSEEVEAHLNTYGSTHWETLPITKAHLKDINYDLVERYLSYRAERSRRNLRYTSREDLLLGLECAARDPDGGQLRPTSAGLLMFGYDPQLHIPQSEVVCIRYQDTLGVGGYVDRKNFTGNIPELIDKAAEFITLHTRVGGRITGFKRADLPEFPLEALREALVNAIVHRDYSRVGETVRVFYYADRVEIHSPGLLLPGITPDDLAHLRVPSRPRNPLIAGFLRDVPGYMERIGSGIRLMVNEMRHIGLPDPEFVEQHEFVVVFRNGTTGEGSGPGTTGALSSRQLVGLQIVQQRGSISSGEYQEATGASARTALRDLTDMVSRGILTTRGKTKSLRYYLP